MKILQHTISNWRASLKNALRTPSLYLFVIFFLFSSWLMFHTFSYNAPTHEIKIAYKLWSDFGAHIPLIRSFSMGDNLERFMRGTVQYPIFPGEPIRYHFLFYMFVGLLEKAGLRIDWALNVPSILGFTMLLISLYILARTLTGSTAVAGLTVIFFLFNGSLGFIRFFSLHPISFQTPTDIIQAKDFPAFAPWGPGEVTAFWNLNIYTNQRHLAGAFSLVILFILTCLHLEKMPFKKQLPWALGWSFLIGALPYFHQPTLLIMSIIMMTYLLFFPKLRLFLITCGLLTTAMVIPQLLHARGSSNPVEWYPGYTIHNELMAQKDILQRILHMASYWWQNIGLHAVFILTGFFIIPKKMRLILLPILPVFIIGNLFKFSIEASANHKFFNFVLMLGSMITAYVIVVIFHKVWNRQNIFTSVLIFYLLSLVTISLTLSGVIDFFVVANDTKGAVMDMPKNQTATWIRDHTPPSAIFLNSSFLYSPASIAGRAIYLGWPYFAWSAGYKETHSPVMRRFYESTDVLLQCELLKRAGLSYVLVDEVKNDPNLPRIDLQAFLKRLKPDYLSSDKKTALYSVNTFCAINTQPSQ